MAQSSHVQSVDDLRRLQAATIELNDIGRNQTDALRQHVENLRQWITVEKRQYWNQQLRKAEQQLQSEIEELHRSIITDKDRKGSTDAKVRVDRSKKRVQLCQQRILQTRNWACELERMIDKFLGRIGSFSELSSQMLPDATHQLAVWIDALEHYTETGGGS